jgi:hypothetical protein
MNRRSFLKGSISGSLLAGSYLSWARAGLLFPLSDSGAGSSAYNLVAVKGGEPAVMFDKGIEALGGMRAFVKKGQKVVVKPNIGWDVGPERAGNTNPQLVAHIIKRCYEAGARQVFVFDHTCDDWQSCYKTSGIEQAARDAGANVAPGNSERY